MTNGTMIGVGIGVVVVGLILYSRSQATPSLPPPRSSDTSERSLGAQIGDFLGSAAPGIARAFNSSNQPSDNRYATDSRGVAIGGSGDANTPGSQAYFYRFAWANDPMNPNRSGARPS